MNGVVVGIVAKRNGDKKKKSKPKNQCVFQPDSKREKREVKKVTIENIPV